MKYKPELRLPDGWTVKSNIEKDELGNDAVHIEAQSERGMIELVCGDLPEGDTAEDEAFANYAEMVGFEGDEDMEVIQCFNFNCRKAYGFSVYDEDDRPMNVFCQEPKKGVCALFVVTAASEECLDDIMSEAEKAFRL